MLALSIGLYPVYAQASFLGFFGLTANADTIASVPAVTNNSQNIPLPTASATLQNPKGGVSGGDISVDDNALIALSGPLGTGADVATDQTSLSDQINVYVVKDGDSLPVIAQMFGVTVNTILWANDMNRGDTIVPGQTLVILPISGISYDVKKGDTLQSIAKHFGANADDIGKYNGLELDSKLVVGTTIMVPDGELSAPPEPAPTQSSGASGLINTGRLPAGSSKLPLKAYGRTRYVPHVGDTNDLGTYFIRPVKGCTITQGLHGYNAVDIGCPTGTPIYAAAEGTVIIARSSGWNGGYGRYVAIKHPNGTETVYGHMSKVEVSAGETVTQGQTIGLMGMTGEATGPHVHFEIRGAKNPLGDNPNYGE